MGNLHLIIRLFSQATTNHDPVIVPGFASGRLNGHRAQLGPSSGRRLSLPEFFEKSPFDHICWSIFAQLFSSSQTRCTLLHLHQRSEMVCGNVAAPLRVTESTQCVTALVVTLRKAQLCSAWRSGRHSAGGVFVQTKPNSSISSFSTPNSQNRHTPRPR